ncbi:ATPase [Vibrio splendidus]
MHTNHIKEFADNYLQPDIHAKDGVEVQPVRKLMRLTGFSLSTTQQAFSGKKNSKAHIKIMELLEIIITNDEAKMKEIRNVANNK